MDKGVGSALSESSKEDNLKRILHILFFEKQDTDLGNSEDAPDN